MNELKYEIDIAFESFLDNHKEYTKEHENDPVSPHNRKYFSIDTTADEEFNVYRAIHDLTEKELRFLYALMTDKVMQAFISSTEE